MIDDIEARIEISNAFGSWLNDLVKERMAVLELDNTAGSGEIVA